MGFASAALLAAAILAHGFEARPAAIPAAVDAVQIEKQVESRLNARVQAAVNEAQAKQTAEFSKVLNATQTRFEAQRQADMASFLQADEYRQKQIARLEVASNEGPAQ